MLHQNPGLQRVSRSLGDSSNLCGVTQRYSQLDALVIGHGQEAGPSISGSWKLIHGESTEVCFLAGPADSSCQDVASHALAPAGNRLSTL